MATKPPSPLRFTRRDAFRGVAGLGAASLLGCSAPVEGSRASASAQTGAGTRVAILGAGAGGIATAYFLNGVCDVTIFESRDKIGGHCDSNVVNYEGESITVDLGAQFFSAETHPIYVTLLEQLGLYNAASPGTNDETLVAPGSLSIFPYQNLLSTFSSALAYLTPAFAVDFLVYIELARAAVTTLSWDTTVSAWIASLPLSQDFKNKLLSPWITALVGAPSAQVATTSARSILQTFALGFPANPFSGGASFCNSKIGLQGNLQTILSSSPGTQVELNAPIQSVAFDGSVWTVTTPAGTFGPFDAVVVNAPPYASSQFLGGLPWATDIVATLNAYQWFTSRILIHTDPAYVYWDRDFWGTYNAEVYGVEAEGSAWLGPFYGKLPSGGTVDIFKSWATSRPADPKQILLERTFRHPLITEQTLTAVRALQTMQGRNGLYFAGTFTTGFDLQESAVYSAMQVANALAPASATLASLNAALAANGLAGISYAI